MKSEWLPKAAPISSQPTLTDTLQVAEQEHCTNGSFLLSYFLFVKSYSILLIEIYDGFIIIKGNDAFIEIIGLIPPLIFPLNKH